MKNKLLHQFWAKAVGVSLLAACSLCAFFCLAGYALGQSYAAQGMDDFLELIAQRALSAGASLLWLGIASAVASAALLVFLLCSAGRHADSEYVRPSKLDRFPLDLLIVLSVVIMFFFFALCRYGDIEDILTQYALIAALIAGDLLSIMLSMTFAARVKTGTLWRSNVVAFTLRLIWKFFRWIGRGLATLFVHFSVLWKVVTAYAALGVISLILLAILFSGGGALAFFLLFALVTGLLAVLCTIALQLQRIKKGGEALALGRMEESIDTRGLWLDLKTHAENLNSIGLGMSRAVEARLKSERMKTDLITNVSHDIKTPLTSIVNYVGLLKQEEFNNPQALSYIEVIDRQALRLKKLTEDVVEASKASSGAIAVNLVPTDVREILHQSLAEYAEKLEKAGLTPVVTIADPLPFVEADGRLLWRVLDNLFSNACKYSLLGTRVYCDASEKNGAIVISVKSISKEAITVPVEELTERFVRGDEARSSEGSGLGLSIAKSLMELQKGGLRLSADGDLFRAEAVFPKAAR